MPGERGRSVAGDPCPVRPERAREGTAAHLWINLIVLGTVLAVVNTLVKPVAKIVAFPVYVLTFGLFALVVNGAMLALAGWLTDHLDALGAGGSVALGLEVSSFGSAIAGSVIVSVVSAIIVSVFRPKDS